MKILEGNEKCKSNQLLYNDDSSFTSKEQLYDNDNFKNGKNRTTKGNNTPHKAYFISDESKILSFYNLIRRSLRRKNRSGRYAQYVTNIDKTEFVEENREVDEFRYLVQTRQDKQIKNRVRSNICGLHRNSLWSILCHCKDFNSNKLLFANQLDDFKNSKYEVKNMRSFFFDENIIDGYGLDKSKITQLQHLLVAIEFFKPDMRCSTLYALCAIFLLYLQPDEAFACINFLFQGTKFLLQSDIAIFASFHTLSWLIKRRKKKVYKSIKNVIGVSCRSEMIDLFKFFYYWIFKLPLPYLVRVIDCFLVEGFLIFIYWTCMHLGHKIFLRVAISLLCLWHQNLYNLKNLKCQESRKKSIIEVNHQMCLLSANCTIPVESLLQMAFSIRGLRRSTINSRQKYYEEKYRDEVIKRRMNSENHARIEQLFTKVFDSKIVSKELGDKLMIAMPERCRLNTPTLLFRLSEHGTSFVQLWNKIDAAEKSLIIIHTISGAIFGAYVSSSWSERNDLKERSKSMYFGTGESFVWKAIEEKLSIYRWAGLVKKDNQSIQIPQMFLAAGIRFLIIGSGGGDAIHISDELTKGRTYPSETFNSPELVSGNEFEIYELEVFEVNPSIESPNVSIV